MFFWEKIIFAQKGDDITRFDGSWYDWLMNNPTNQNDSLIV
jgi:hypothetical protein